MDTLMAWDTVSTKQERIVEIARHCNGAPILSLAHYIDMDWMYCAYDWTRRDGAAGIDGVTAAEYEKDLEGSLQSLIDRIKSGLYRAPAVKRVYIPKEGSGEKRPIGIPTYEDKILQRAVQMVLEPIYEREFAD
jgi:retron-type reverse transcriptase